MNHLLHSRKKTKQNIDNITEGFLNFLPVHLRFMGLPPPPHLSEESNPPTLLWIPSFSSPEVFPFLTVPLPSSPCYSVHSSQKQHQAFPVGETPTLPVLSPPPAWIYFCPSFTAMHSNRIIHIIHLHFLCLGSSLSPCSLAFVVPTLPKLASLK